MQRIREAAEKAKIELSSSMQATVNLPYITVDADKNPMFLDETITRAQFQQLSADLLARCKKPVEAVLKDAINKLQILPLLAGDNISQEFITPTVANCVDLVIQCAIDPFGLRRVIESEYRDWETDRKSTRLNSSHRL